MSRILVVDDEDALRLILGRQLEDAGHEVTTACDGMDAVQKLSAAPFDVIVSDMKMPRLDGMGLLARAKELAPDTEFVILTGHGNMDNAVQAFKTGNVFDYLVKPLSDIRELDAVVARALERRHLRSENSRLSKELELQQENQRLYSELQIRVNELEVARKELAFLAERDGLTSLFNHRTIHQKLKETLDSAVCPFVSLILIDMDGFKQLNDTFGHPVGDKALKHVSSAMLSAAGSTGIVGRSGGDEFMIVLPNCDSEQAKLVVAHIVAYLSDHAFVSPEGSTIPLRLSFGVADSATAGESYLVLMTAADSALYRSKHDGGNRVQVYLDGSSQPSNSAHSGFDVLDGLVMAIDRKDAYTKDHSEDMTTYALQLARAVGCSDETADIVRVAGLLHDVGKIGVPDTILRKPGKLTADEYEVMKKHVTLSTLIIHGLPHLSEIQDAVSCHHERWDGTGYPLGLKGEEIPMLGRIMAIADAFSAMTLDRPYRTALSLDAALREIEHNSGTQFDPQLAGVFVEMMRRSIAAPFELRKAA